MPWTTTGVGHYQTGERSFGVFGRKWRAGQSRGVLHGSGYGGTALSFMEAPHRALPLTLANRGVPCASFDFGGSALFGNDTARSRVTTAKGYAEATWGYKSDKLLLIGGSMGGMTALRWALQNPAQVAAIVLNIALVDVHDFYDNDRGGLAAAVGTAYGGRPTNDQNPALRAAELAGIPIRVYSSVDDSLCTRATHQAFCTASGAQLVDIGAVGHNFAAADWDEDIADFLGAHA